MVCALLGKEPLGLSKVLNHPQESLRAYCGQVFPIRSDIRQRGEQRADQGCRPALDATDEEHVRAVYEHACVSAMEARRQVKLSRRDISEATQGCAVARSGGSVERYGEVAVSAEPQEQKGCALQKAPFGRAVAIARHERQKHKGQGDASTHRGQHGMVEHRRVVAERVKEQDGSLLVARGTSNCTGAKHPRCGERRAHKR